MSEEILRRNREVTRALRNTDIGRAVRRRMFVLGAIIAAVFLLTLAVAWTAFSARATSRKAERAARAAATNAQVLNQFCAQGNAFRREVRDAIRGSVDVSTEGLISAASRAPQQPKTQTERAQQEKALADFRADIARRVAAKVAQIKDRNCSQIPARMTQGGT